MRQRKSRVFIVCVTIFLVGIIICAVSARQKQNNADIIYQHMASNLKGYPILVDPYCSTVGYCCIDGAEYVLIKNGSKTIYGMRTPDGKTAYIFEGQTWVEEPDGTFRSTDSSAFLEDEIENRVSELLADQTVTYTYQKVSGATLPLIVHPTDTSYLEISRSGYENCMEVMVSSDGEESSMRWSVIHEDGQILLYLYVSIRPIKTSDVDVLGWGAVSNNAMELLIR